MIKIFFKEGENIKRFLYHTKFVFEQLFGKIFITIMLLSFSMIFMKNIINFDISVLFEKPYIYFSISAMVIYIIYLIVSAKHLYVIAEHTEAFLESTTEQSVDIYLDLLETDIDIVSKKLDILKSFSPISVIVFLVGFFVDKTKLPSLEINIFFIITICGILIYFLTIYDNFQLYKIYKQEFNSRVKLRRQDNQSKD